ncbi:MAG: hypothetical protein JST46_09045 [Bacteroidetes bacterium]|nr:hypothetical protein [Bacteroidota bacterium]
MKRLILFLLFFPALAVAQSKSTASVHFSCTDKTLEQGFTWATRQALGYVRRNGDPVGDWYEAALPNREAFCMRDVSHQLIGANILGLADINRNLLTKFVKPVAESRDWCGYWEIDRLDRPAPVDYKSDTDFWYNLPANFDILDACLRQYYWTGDTTYLINPDFQRFYKITCNEYTSKWDHDGNGIMEGTRDAKLRYRGIGSYNEDDSGVTGNDLIAAQVLGLRRYTEILTMIRNTRQVASYQKKADRLEYTFEKTWWDDSKKTYHQFLREDGTWTRNDIMLLFLLRWNFVREDRIEEVLKRLDETEATINVESFSYWPLEVYRYGQQERATALLKKLVSPELKRREYPEVSYAAIEAYTMGLMGIEPNAKTRTIRTLSRLDQSVEADMENIPIFDGSITVRHDGMSSTRFTNHTKKTINWVACFYKDDAELRYNGRNITGKITRDRNNRRYAFFSLMVKPGETATVSVL